MAKAPGKQISPSYIRSVVAMNATGKHQFGIVAGQNPDLTSYNVERRLNQNNSFVVTHFGFFLAYAASAAALATAKRYTYGNPAALIPGDNSPLPSDVAAVESLYNGKLTVVTDQSEIIPAYDMQRFHQGPESQEYVGNAATAGALLMNRNPSDSFGPGAGFVSTFPFVYTIDGARTQNYTINSVAQTALSDVYLIFEARGFEITQGAGSTLIFD